MISGVLIPCLDCGELSPNARCEQHDKEHKRDKESRRDRSNRPDRFGSANTHWKRLSAKARKLQPFCLDCGSKDNLESDHLPSAWLKTANHKPLTLDDIEVVCADCNVKRGSSKPGTKRYEDWINSNV